MVAWLCMLAFVAADVTARVQPEPQLSPEELRRLEREQAEREVAHLPSIEVTSLQQLVKFTIEDGMLVAVTQWAPIHAEARIVTPELPGIIRVRVFDLPQPQAPTVGRNFMIIQNDLTDPGSLHVMTHIGSTAGWLTLARDAASDDMRSSIQLIQSPNWAADVDEKPVRLLVTESDADGQSRVDLRLEAMSFDELRRNHPREVEKYLRPILRDFQQDQAIFAVDPRIAWQVLGRDYQPEAETIQHVHDTLQKLDADDFRQRENAMEELKKLGQPAALVLARGDRSAFSTEQNAAVDSFLAEYLPLNQQEIDRLAASEEFLLDAMSSDDSVLRTLAAKRLQEIRQTPIAFDPQAPAEARIEQLKKLREALAPPATAPAAGP